MKFTAIRGISAFLVLCVCLFAWKINDLVTDDWHAVSPHLTDAEVLHAAHDYAYRRWLRRVKLNLKPGEDPVSASKEAYLGAFPGCCQILHEEQVRLEERVPHDYLRSFALRAYVRIDDERPTGSGTLLLYVDMCGDLTHNYLD